MRRFFAALAITVIGLYLTLSYKSSPASRVAAPASSAETTTVPAGPPDSASVPAGPPNPGSTPTTAAKTGSRTINGDVVSTRYGDVQVAIVLNGKQIVDVKALQLPFDRARSEYISQTVAPILHDEVLSAQSAQIDTISGATYTSDAYAQSLQSALDHA